MYELSARSSMDTGTDRTEHVRARVTSVTDSSDVESAGLSYMFVAARREHHGITILGGLFLRN